MNFHDHLEKPISELFFQVWCSGRITKDNRYELKSAILKDSLGDEDMAAIDRLLHAVRRGWLALETSGSE